MKKNSLIHLIPPTLLSLSRDIQLPLSLPFLTPPAVTSVNALARPRLDHGRAPPTAPCFLFFLPPHHRQFSSQIHLPHLFP